MHIKEEVREDLNMQAGLQVPYCMIDITYVHAVPWSVCACCFQVISCVLRSLSTCLLGLE
jgi:hypothetical protein